MEQQKKRWKYLFGVVIGFFNGLLGAGGGMVAVPLLRSMGLRGEGAHATSISIILPLAVLSGSLYLGAGHLQLGDALPYLPGGLLGACCGAWLLPRIDALWLRRIFGVVILFAAGKLLLR